MNARMKPFKVCDKYNTMSNIYISLNMCQAWLKELYIMCESTLLLSSFTGSNIPSSFYQLVRLLIYLNNYFMYNYTIIPFHSRNENDRYDFISWKVKERNVVLVRERGTKNLQCVRYAN